MSEPHKFPPVPTSRDELLIASLRHANEVGGLLNDIGAEVSRVTGEDCDSQKYERLYDLLRRRFLENSALHLFIGASNIGVDLPDDIRDDIADEIELPE